MLFLASCSHTGGVARNPMYKAPQKALDRNIASDGALENSKDAIQENKEETTEEATEPEASLQKTEEVPEIAARFPPRPPREVVEKKKEFKDDPEVYDPSIKRSLAAPRPMEEELRDKFNFTYYEPLYFIFGNPASRINFSFKYEFIRNVPFYLGYVQNVFWLLKDRSKPFQDANFNPRLFYRFDLNREDTESYIDLIPYEHKSNGQDSIRSRSFDGSGAKISKRVEYENWSFKAYLKGLWRYRYDGTNKDIEEFVGPFEMGFSILQYSFDWLDRGELSYRLYTAGKYGEDFSRASHEVGFSFRIFGDVLTPSIYFQYFNGYSESLLHYDKREDNFRIGFLL